MRLGAACWRNAAASVCKAPVAGTFCAAVRFASQTTTTEAGSLTTSSAVGKPRADDDEFEYLKVTRQASRDMTSAKAYRLMNRELIDEGFKPEKPPEPQVPRGWTLKHEHGTGEFWVSRLYENEIGSLEELRVRCSVEIKNYEETYRQDDGEREEPEHFNFSLFVSKPKKGDDVGGLEFSLTSVDAELVLDALAVHSNRADFVVAMTQSKKCKTDRDLRYRGPYINELDEDFADELMNYLDDRGIHNHFAEYIQMQAHMIEQIEYEHMLKIIRAFAATPALAADKAERANNNTGSEGGGAARHAGAA